MLASANEVLTEYDGSRSAKDQITRLSIALNEKLVTLKALDESILSVVDDGEIESQINESENFRMKIQEALVKLQSCQVAHDQQENVQRQETHQKPKLSASPSCRSQHCTSLTETRNAGKNNCGIRFVWLYTTTARSHLWKSLLICEVL